MKKPDVQEYNLDQRDFEKIDSLNEKIEQMSSVYAKWALILLAPTILYFFNWEATVLFYISGIAPALFWGLFRTISRYFLNNHYFTDDLKSLEKKIQAYRKSVEQYKEWFIRTKEQFWFSLDGYKFEHEVAHLFKQVGYQADVTRGSGDGGVDIYIRNDEKKAIVQCKAYKKPIGPSVVRDLYGVMQHLNVVEAFLVTLNGVTIGAEQFIQEKNITVLDVRDLIRLQMSVERS